MGNPTKTAEKLNDNTEAHTADKALTEDERNLLSEFLTWHKGEPEQGTYDDVIDSFEESL